MLTNVVLPNLGFGMTEGRLIAWLKQPGDPVRKGEALAEVESDKATVELEAVVDGILEEIIVPVDSVIPVDSVLARIRIGEAAPIQAAREPAPETPRATPIAQRVAQEHGIDLATVPGSGPGGRIRREDVELALRQPNAESARALAAPAVRRLARVRGIDLRAVRGTGKAGRVTRADLEAYQAAPVPLAPRTVAERWEVPLSPMRSAIARRMAQSAQEAPHFYVSAELDLSGALQALPAEIGINALLLYLTVQTLRDVPELNATFENGRLYHYRHVDLCVAVAVEGGLLTPVLPRADDYSLAGLADRLRELLDRVRAGRLRPEDMGNGTFTVSNLGMISQVEQFTAILNPPQVGILAAGAAKPRPFIVNGGLQFRETVHLTLSCDHRVIDGITAARFLEAFDRRLQTFRS